MRYLIAIAISVSLAGAAAATASPPTDGTVPAPVTASLSAPVYVLAGGGFGHGVGLSQYGALAQAQAGRGYRDILGFYYPGTRIGPPPLTKVRVLLASGRQRVRVGSAAALTVRDATGTKTQFPAGELVLGADLAPAVDGIPTPLPGPLTFAPAPGATLTLDGKGYRGQLRVSVVDGALQVIDVVGLEAYILGVVPGEMPAEWPAAALEAQAVAARSYALASLVKNRPFDLYADPRSQVYYGVGAESPATTAAVQATRGQVLTYGGKVATAFYYSSSGGRTASSQDVFGLPIPYLLARDDPWDAASPFHRWAPKTYTAAGLAEALGLSSPVVDVQIVQTASGRPASVTLVTRAGVTVPLRAADVRARLGLRSTAFRFGVLQVARPSGPVVAGTPVTVTGVARDVDDARLEKLAANGVWAQTAKVEPTPDGSFAITVRPKATATFRLTAAGLPGPALTVTVTSGAIG